MSAYNLQIIGCHTLTKNIIGCSTQIQVTTEHADLSDLSNKQKIVNLWRQFMINYYYKLIPYCVDDNIISLEEPITKKHVRKWASVEIASGTEYLPQAGDLKKLTINGEYFGFIHTGTATNFNLVYQQAIDYLRNNNIQINQNRPRLEIMHRNYLPDDPLSKEEFWIPIINR